MCVETSNILAFCSRVASRLRGSARFPGRAGRERIGRRVEYYDAAGPPGPRWALPDRIALSKLPEFAHQKEFRSIIRGPSDTARSHRRLVVLPDLTLQR